MTHAGISADWRARCGTPDKKLQVFGITGTNGKTTGVYLMRHFLNEAGRRCGMVSTVVYDDGCKLEPPTHTTPDPGTFFPLLARMADNGCRAAAMEFSSHALAQDRLAGVELAGAVFTNLTGDHLDYHRDMESYYQAKKRLFTDYLMPESAAVINVDDAAGRRLAGELQERGRCRVLTFGRGPEADWRITGEHSDADGCRFLLTGPDCCFDVDYPLPGRHNISNLCGVLVLLTGCGMAPELLRRGLARPVYVPGRLEKVLAPTGARFYIDYAHTDDALKNVLTTLREVCPGKLYVVFGAGGDRDRTKRPRMGAVASELADRVIITSDNPRTEPPEAIMADIVAGLRPGTEPVLLPSRRDAIEHAFESAGAGDIVLIAGKGHEDYQEIDHVRHHFNDREELEKLFK